MHVQRRTIAIAAALISGITLATAPIATNVADAAPNKTYCNTAISDTTIEGDVIAIPNSDYNETCLLRNVRVTGNVVIEDNSRVAIESFTRIEGNVSSTFQSYVWIRDSRIGGTVSLRGGVASIYKSRVSGDVRMDGNYGAYVERSHFGSTLEVEGNKRADVIYATVDGKLSGQNNVTTREKNRARGGATGHFGGPDGTYFWDDCPGNNCDDS